LGFRLNGEIRMKKLIALIVIATLFALTAFTTPHSKAQQEAFCGKAGVDFYYGLLHREIFTRYEEVGKCNPVGKYKMSIYYTKANFENIKVR